MPRIKFPAISRKGLVLYLPLWKLDGASFMSKDAYGHLVSVTGAIWTPQGRTFDGDDFISLTSPFASGATFTIIARFKQTARQDTRIVMVNLEPGVAGKQGIGFGITAATPYLRVVNDGIAWGSGGFVPSLDQWYLAMMTRSGTTTNLYKDGESAVISTLTNTQQDSGTKIHLGKGQDIADPPVATYFLKGIEGEVWGYNRLLSVLEFQQIYLQTKWRYR